MPNTFLRPYLNFKSISLVVRSKCPSMKGRYMYGSLAIAKTRWRLHFLLCPWCDSVGDNKFNSYVSYVLTLIKAYSIFAQTHITWFFCPFTSIGDEWEDGRPHSSPSLSKFIPPTHNVCHCL